MTTLRSRLIRLAKQRPSLRPHLLPLLKVAASKPSGFLIGSLTANIAGDFRYTSKVDVYLDGDFVHVEASQTGAVGGMDGPGGRTDFSAMFQRTVARTDPKRVLDAIKAALRSDETLKSYARPMKSFYWYLPENGRLVGLSLKNLIQTLGDYAGEISL